MRSDCQIEIEIIPPLLRPMTPDDSLVLVSQQGENEGRSGTVGLSSSPGPLESWTAKNSKHPGIWTGVDRFSLGPSLGLQTSFNEIQ